MNSDRPGRVDRKKLVEDNYQRADHMSMSHVLTRILLKIGEYEGEQTKKRIDLNEWRLVVEMCKCVCGWWMPTAHVPYIPTPKTYVT